MAQNDKKGSDKKEGVSVEQIENLAKKYANEGFLALAVILAMISSMFDFFSGPRWSLLFGGIAAAVTFFFPHAIRRMIHQLASFVSKQETSTMVVLGIVRLVIALFLPFVIFAAMGFLSALSYFDMGKAGFSKNKSRREDSSSEDRDHF